MPESVPFLEEVVLFLVATVVIVPLFQRMRVSPILGFLGVGLLAGPSGLGRAPGGTIPVRRHGSRSTLSLALGT